MKRPRGRQQAGPQLTKMADLPLRPRAQDWDRPVVERPGDFAAPRATTAPFFLPLFPRVGWARQSNRDWSISPAVCAALFRFPPIVPMSMLVRALKISPDRKALSRKDCAAVSPEQEEPEAERAARLRLELSQR